MIECESDFVADNIHDIPVRVTIYFTLEQEDDEFTEFGPTTFKRCWSYAVFEYMAHTLSIHCEPYEVTTEDIEKWGPKIKEALKKEIKRQTRT